MCFCRWWTWWTFIVSEIWYLLTKRNSLILAWHTLIYFMQKLEHFRQCPWQKLFPHITLIRSDTDFTKWMNCKCIIYSFGMILFWEGASQTAFNKFYLVLIHMYLKKSFNLKRSLQNHEFLWQNVLNSLSPSVYLDLFAPHNTEHILAPYFVIQPSYYTNLNHSFDHWFKCVFFISEVIKFYGYPSLKGGKHFWPYIWKRHHVHFAYQMSVVNILTWCQNRSFARKYSTKSWVFATNVLNDLLPSVYLDLYEPYTW